MTRSGLLWLWMLPACGEAAAPPDAARSSEIDSVVTVSEAAPQVHPVASSPWAAPCAPIWERLAYRPDWSRLSPDAWLVWDRET